MEFSVGNRALLEKLDSSLYLVAARPRGRMRVAITDVGSHQGRNKVARVQRAESRRVFDRARSRLPFKRFLGPTWRRVKRTHNLRYRFHDRVRQEVER